MAPPSRDYIYGLNPAFEVVRAGRRRIVEAFLADPGRHNQRLPKLRSLLESRGVPITEIDRGRLQQLCRSHEHQNIVLKTTLYPYMKTRDLVEKGHSRLLLLDNVEDPHNVGAILRTADVFGFHGVMLPVKGVPGIYPSVVKVSAGASEFLDIAQERSANSYVRAAREQGYTVAALEMKGKTPLAELAADAPEKLLLVIGGEDRAVGQYILNEADHVVKIPQQGRVNSLNAGVAAALAMHALAAPSAEV